LEPASDNQRQTCPIRASGGLLVEADHISSRIAESRRDLGRVRADRLLDLAPMGYHRVNRRSHTVNHDVNQEAGLCCGRAPQHSRAAHFPGRIVKSSAAVAAFPDVPAEDPLIELGRARNVGGGHLDVTDLPIRNRRWHQRSFQGAAILATLKLKSNPHRPSNINLHPAAARAARTAAAC